MARKSTDPVSAGMIIVEPDEIVIIGRGSQSLEVYCDVPVDIEFFKHRYLFTN